MLCSRSPGEIEDTHREMGGAGSRRRRDSFSRPHRAVLVEDFPEPEPDAEVKVFLTASAEERARRRMLELEERGTPEPYAAILRAIQERDWNDTHRDAAPLRQAEDAVLLDTTALDFVQSEDALLHIIRERTGL